MNPEIPLMITKEFETYKAQNPDHFPKGTPLSKQLAVFSVIKDIFKKRELKRLSDLKISRFHRQV